MTGLQWEAGLCSESGTFLDPWDLPLGKEGGVYGVPMVTTLHREVQALSLEGPPWPEGREERRAQHLGCNGCFVALPVVPAGPARTKITQEHCRNRCLWALSQAFWVGFSGAGGTPDQLGFL